MQLLAGDLVPPVTNGLMFVANLYVSFCGFLVLRDCGFGRLLGFAVGYLLLFALLVVVAERVSLFILLILLYASVFRVGLLLGLFAIFVASYILFQPYAFESFAPLAGAFGILWFLHKRGASRFMLVCASAGLLALAAVLLPLLHLLVQDTPQTLWAAFSRDDVQSALGVSLLSSTLATLLETWQALATAITTRSLLSLLSLVAERSLILSGNLYLTNLKGGLSRALATPTVISSRAWGRSDHLCFLLILPRKTSALERASYASAMATRLGEYW